MKVIESKAKIKDVKNICEGIKHYAIKTDKEIQFKAGQFFILELNYEGKKVRNPYSIASSKEMEFCIKINEKGDFTPKLFELKEGNDLIVKGPFGNFVLNENGKNKIFISAGVGIAPFRGMIQENKNSKITLLQGARNRKELAYSEEFEKEDLNYMPTLTKPRENWKGLKGRVTEHIDKLELENSEVYICGMNEMVEDTIKKLKEKGFDKDIYYEKFG